MSGKSTLLRSLGVNTVLALAGAPVCAEHFRLPPVELATSMRITDSLNDGVSFFMAELARLKSIVDKAKQRDKESGIPLFYLLDEILQGTNTAERHIAVTRVVGHLLKRYTIGAISTHDLDLAVADELKNHCQTVHFRETIHSGVSGETMSFDYKLRPGIASTTNALQLLKIVGLAED
jgi:DNA mismatch repair ATPase MutS